MQLPLLGEDGFYVVGRRVNPRKFILLPATGRLTPGGPYSGYHFIARYCWRGEPPFPPELLRQRSQCPPNMLGVLLCFPAALTNRLEPCQ